jgi:potassium efflux system protein
LAHPLTYETSLRLLRRAALALMLLPWAGQVPAQAAKPTPDAAKQAIASTLPTRDTVNARIEQVNGLKDLEASAKARLLDLYRKVQSSLDAIAASTEATERFRSAASDAPAETRRIRDALGQPAEPVKAVSLAPGAPLPDLEQQLQKQKADLAALENRVADLQKAVADTDSRPVALRQRLAEARREAEKAEEDRRAAPLPDDAPAVAEARRWMLDANAAALSAEVRMLEEELLSQPARLDLLRAQADQAAGRLEAAKAAYAALEEQVNDRRRAEAERAKEEAKAAERDAAGKHPLLKHLAEQNAALGETLGAMASALAGMTAEQQATDQLARRIDEDFRNARKKLEVGGLSEALGRLLLQQKRTLPNPRDFARKESALEEVIGAAGLRQLQYSEERRALLNLDSYLDALLAPFPEAERAGIRAELQSLAASRRDLLDKAVSAQESYLRGLGELVFLYRQVQASASSYDQFLTERLLWIRSNPPVTPQMLTRLPAELADLFAPAVWRQTAAAAGDGLLVSPLLALGLVGTFALLSQRRRIRARLRATGKNVGKISTDSFPLTAQALGWTVLLAVGFPALLAVIGAAVLNQPLPLPSVIGQMIFDRPLTGASPTRSIGVAMQALALPLFILSNFRLLCLPGGVAQVHFRWTEATCRLLRRRIAALIATILPAAFVAILVIRHDSLRESSGLGVVIFAAISLSLSVFFYGVLHPSRGAVKGPLREHPRSLLARTRYLWFPLIVALPLSLTVLAMRGFLYTAGSVTTSMVQTVYLAIGLIIVHEVVVRWLLLVRRRLTLKALRERRVAERAAAEHEEAEEPTLQIEEPEVDLAALSEESTKLLRAGIAIAGALGVWLIWSAILPALNVFNEITLWAYTTTVDGVEKAEPFTLADLGLGLVLVFITIVAVRRLPALLEIVLLHRLEITAADRFTITTLSRYGIATIGAVAVFNALGGNWSEIQWLIAALGVGIGFGLQEIVANFISGLIILFERPLRVGDAVTVGDISGVVSRIQIRATTITTWDRRELLVPNKEFITGRLLNWSLTDPITRIEVPVGVDYGADVKRAMQLMIEIAQKHPRVLEDPKPAVSFESFGDNSLMLYLRCFVASYDYRVSTRSELHAMLYEKFREAGIGIAFPQRDVHLSAAEPLPVRMVRDEPAS